jgi:hypothetical protein
MLLIIISSVKVGKYWQKKVLNGCSKVEVVQVPKALNFANWFFGITGMIACLSGIALLAYVALKIAGGINGNA